jgi:predicted nucleotidyltransferase
MKDEYIIEKMYEAAEDKGVLPIAGRERGSRMIGVAHDESDWDAFLLFAQPAEEYALLSGYTDTLSRKFDDGDVDIHGWNVQKFAELAQDSNPNAVEFAMSENEYFNNLPEDGLALDRITADLKHNFNHMALYHHYLSLAKSNYEKYVASGNDCTYNRQFYVMRATMMAKHIREEGTFPKLNVWEFLDQTDAPHQEERNLLTLLSEKKENGELGEANNIVGMYLDDERDIFMEPTDERINNPDKELLNDLIHQSVTR